MRRSPATGDFRGAGGGFVARLADVRPLARRPPATIRLLGSAREQHSRPIRADASVRRIRDERRCRSQWLGGRTARLSGGNGSDGLVVEAVRAIAGGIGEYAEGEQVAQDVCDGRRGVGRVLVEVGDRAR